MTALGKLLRTTAFKLTLVYLTVFALFAAFLDEQLLLRFRDNAQERSGAFARIQT